MSKQPPTSVASNTFERIKHFNSSGGEFWSSREFAQVLNYTDYRNFELVIEKARTACLNSAQRVEDHFVEVTDMIEIGKGGQRPVRSIMMSRYACYLIIQNADPSKEIVALGQTYFAVQTRRQELNDAGLEGERRLLLREEIKKHNTLLADTARVKQRKNSVARKLQARARPISHIVKVGAKVRQTIKELGGVMPEKLPTAESIKKLAARRKKRLGK